MDENATTAIIIGTAIFVSVLIISLILASFDEMKEIYTLVKDTDIGINTGYVENYHGRVLNGMDLLNALKMAEVEYEVSVIIEYPGKQAVVSAANDSGLRESEIMSNLLKEGEGQYNYSNNYNVSVDGEGDYVVIKFFAIE